MNVIPTIFVATCALSLLVDCRPTVYILNENDKLEPALVPVSSTVIPLAVYKVGTGIKFSTKKGVKPESGKLITGGKKTSDDDDNAAINIKQISKEEFHSQS